MRHKRKSRQPHELQAQAEPREARPSGATRITPDVHAASHAEQTVWLSLPITRRNAPLAKVPSIVVDASYLQAVAAERARVNARRSKLALVAVGAFLCGSLSVPLALKLVRPVARLATTTHQAKVGAAPPPSLPVSATPQSEPPQRAVIVMDLRNASRYVRAAEALRQAGRVEEARPVLERVLSARPGHPASLAAMAALELDSGNPALAVHWAQLAVRSLPSSIKYGELLSRASAAASVHAESSAVGAPLGQPGTQPRIVRARSLSLASAAHEPGMSLTFASTREPHLAWRRSRADLALLRGETD